MDELDARGKIRDVRLHLEEQGWDLDWARRTLSQYEDLRDMAGEIAQVVFARRWPHAGSYSFEISFDDEYTDGRESVTASFYSRGDTDSFRFPLSYLVRTYEDIVTAEDILKDEQAAEHARKLAAASEESKRRDLETLRRLRERYPDD